MSGIKTEVKEAYGRVARGPVASACCQTELYTAEDLRAVPAGAYLGEGSGNPVAYAELKPGDRVLDLGAGAGIDVFLAASKIGASGKAVGIDLTPEMVERATKLAREVNIRNIEFHLGDMERLPFPDRSFDAVISNCVINLAESRQAVLKEAFRVLKPGGRLVISDIVRDGGDIIASQESSGGSCYSRAITISEYRQRIAEAGFTEIKTLTRAEGCCGCGTPESSSGFLAATLGATAARGSFQTSIRERNSNK
jgi:SAM-dependent methyltransferase